MMAVLERCHVQLLNKADVNSNNINNTEKKMFYKDTTEQEEKFNQKLLFSRVRWFKITITSLI